MLVTSGTASIGSETAALAPITISSSAAAKTSGRFLSERPTIAARSGISLLLFAERGLEDRALQAEDTFAYDFFTLAEAGEHLDLAERGRAERDGPAFEVSARLANEDDRSALEVGDRRPEDDDLRF